MDLTHFRIFRRNLEPGFTHYSCEQQRKMESMNNQDSASIVITFLLLLPWLGRAAVSAMALWRAHHGIPNQGDNCA
jgi:hypothetical protein